MDDGRIPPTYSYQPASRTRFYRDKQNGKVMGVCAGIADYTGFDVSLVRICLLATVFFSGGSVLPLYFIAGWVTPVKPRELRYADGEDRQYWQSVRASPGRSARDIRSRFRDLDRRLADIESYVTTENRSLEREIEQLRIQGGSDVDPQLTEILNFIARILPFIAVIVGVSVAGAVFSTWLKIKNGYPLSNSWGMPMHPKTDREAGERIKLLTNENAQLRAEIGSLKDRLETVERIITDRPSKLAREIDALGIGEGGHA